MAHPHTIPDPEWAAISAHIPPLEHLDPSAIPEYRKVIAGLVKEMVKANPGPTEGLKVVEKMIQGKSDNDKIPAKVFIPDARANEAGGFPLLIWAYGGGWVVGALEGDEPLLRRTAVDSRIVCVGIDYRKAPEDPFPAALDDFDAALKWALNSASEFSINVSKGVLIGGLSSGANLSAALAHRSLRDPELKGAVTGQLLIMPCVIMPQAYPDKFKPELPSFDNPEATHFVTKDRVLTYTEAYLSGEDPANPEVSPGLAESFEGLPPAYIQVAGLDVLRDDGILYERLLREAGVRTKLDEYNGLPHGFHVPLRDLKATKKQERDFLEGINWLLGRTE